MPPIRSIRHFKNMIRLEQQDMINRFESKSDPLVRLGCLQVYLTLCAALASSAVGAYLHVVWNIGGTLTMLGCVGSIAWLFSVPVYEEVSPSARDPSSSVRLSFVS
jgi:hypothetical protein